MGGTVRKATGQEDKRRANEAKQEAEMQAKKEKIKLKNERNQMARVAGESAAASRRARRGGRALLSEARLAPEQGVATLGNTEV
jgi:hypothetical protein